MSLKVILIEGRVEDVYTKHFTDNTSTFITDIYMNEIVPGSAEINPNHKYLDWITKNWSPSDVSEEGVMEHNLKEILLAVSPVSCICR